MNVEQYQPTLDALELMTELRRLLVTQRRGDRLICRYLADLADGMVSYPALTLLYANVEELVHDRFALSVRSIRERIRVGKALRRLPRLDAAMAAGELTYSQVREVTRVANAETERLWLQAARRLSMRALERRVAAASTEPRSRSRAAPSDSAARNPLVDLPTEVLELLQQAMRLARSGSEQTLTDAQALAAVARAAIAHFAGSTSAERSPASATHGGSSLGTSHGGSSLGTSHGGSSLGTSSADDAAATSPRTGEAPGGTNAPQSESPPTAARETTDPEAAGSSGGTGDGLRSTHSGSPPAASSWSGPLSDDAQLLLDLIGSPGYWTLDTLRDATAMTFLRVSSAAFDLLVRHLVTRGPLGAFELSLPTFKRAG